MAITSIYIKDANGNTVTRLTRAFRLQTNPYIARLSVDMSDRLVSLTGPSVAPDYLKSAYDSYINEPYLTRISGVDPDSDGQFFIFFDKCGSYAKYQQLVDRVLKKGLTLFDSCPACQTCETKVRTKLRFENMKASINLMKDLMLASASVAESRWNALFNASIRQVDVMPASCSSLTARPDPGNTSKWSTWGGWIDRYLWERSARRSLRDDMLASSWNGGSIPWEYNKMLANYVTTVNMWNYAVMQPGVQVDITPVKDDDKNTTGYSISTVQRVPLAQSAMRALCTVTIAGTIGGKRNAFVDGISVYLDNVKAWCEPDADSLVPTVTTAHTRNDSLSQGQLNTTATAEFPTMTHSGSYGMRLTYIPFNNLVMVDNNGNAIATNVDMNSSLTPSTTAVGNDSHRINTGAQCTALARTNAVASSLDWENSRRWPSYLQSETVSGHVYINWKLYLDESDTPTIERTSSYYFAAVHLRSPLGVFQAPVWKDIDQYRS